MAKQAAKPVKITETVLRDAHQSLIATRMTTEQMLPIIEKLERSASPYAPKPARVIHIFSLIQGLCPTVCVVFALLGDTMCQ